MPKYRTKSTAVLPRPPTPRLALSIPELCEAHGISEGFYCNWRRQGKGPREMEDWRAHADHVESAAEWRRHGEETRLAEATVVPKS